MKHLEGEDTEWPLLVRPEKCPQQVFINYQLFKFSISSKVFVLKIEEL